MYRFGYAVTQDAAALRFNKINCTMSFILHFNTFIQGKDVKGKKEFTYGSGTLRKICFNLH